MIIPFSSYPAGKSISSRSLMPLRPRFFLPWLLLCAGCHKSETAPYFPFAAADQQWLQAQNNDEWLFGNSRGQQLRFRLTQVGFRHKIPVQATGVLGNQGVPCYYDDYRFSVSRVDSVAYAGSFLFRSIPDGGDARSTSGVYAAVSEWKQLLGTSLPDGGQYCQQLGMVGDVRQLPATALMIRGQYYNHVLHFAASADIPIPCRQSAARPAMSQVWYDRSAGIVQMQSVDGELWQRLP